MPLLDVSEFMTDIDFIELGLVCFRTVQSVGANGLAVNTPITIPFIGVVTQVKGEDLTRNEVGEIISGSILVCTRFRLTDGRVDGIATYTADVIQREHGNRKYTVVNVLPYSKFGRGFTEATCELLPLAGSYPPTPGYPPYG